MENDYLDIYSKFLQKEKILSLREERNSRLYNKGSLPITQAYEEVSSFDFACDDFSKNEVVFGNANSLYDSQRQQLEQQLLALNPWRKGPFDIAGIKLDAEWRSDKKWERLLPRLRSLEGKKVADIGANNGYYMYKMLAQNPEFVLGIEPTTRYYFQFQTLQKLTLPNQLYMEPFGVEHINFYPNFFDTIFCMGILYHHFNPISILKDLYNSLNKGGQLIIESQGINGDEEIALFPKISYAKVKNTYFVPTARCLANWVNRAKFRNVEVFCTHPMSSDEQRKTQWMQGFSYNDFINIEQNKTSEGYPVPIRIFVVAEK